MSFSKCVECTSTKGGTPVIPNISLVTGKVLKYEKETTDTISIINVLIESIQDYGNRPNLLRGREGEMIIFYSKEDISHNIQNQKISGEASFRGDEHGGKWWLNNIRVIK